MKHVLGNPFNSPNTSKDRVRKNKSLLGNSPNALGNPVRKNRVLLGILVLVLGILACTKGTPEETIPKFSLLTPTPNSTDTALVVFVEITNSPEPTQTPALVIVTQTPNELGEMCVTADEAVYLRPSPSTTFYPIDPLPKNAKVALTGTKDGNWIFVNYGEQSGWVNGNFLGNCQEQ